MIDINQIIKGEVENLGFSLWGVTKPQQPLHYSLFDNWLARNEYGNMHYLANDLYREQRKDPTKILATAKSILIVGFPYSATLETGTKPKTQLLGCIASYAQGKDYHETISSNLRTLINQVQSKTGLTIENRVICDSGPLLEKENGQRAGLGWVGKNSLLISPSFGSFFNLGELISDLKIKETPPFENDLCGDCRLCIENCPTHCIREDRTLAADRCISYLTVEKKDIINRELRHLMGNWVFGCDTCQMVCPRNQKMIKKDVNPQSKSGTIDLLKEMNLNESTFMNKYRFSSIKRIKRRGLIRNIVIALGNIQDPRAISPLSELFFSERDTIVRIYIAGALGKIGTHKSKSILEKARKFESDSRVMEEISLSLSEIN